MATKKQIEDLIISYSEGATDNKADGVMYKLLADEILKLIPIVLASDCTCTGDQYGWATNPNCIIHGDKRK